MADEHKEQAELLRILRSVRGWGNVQATAFLARLHDEERAALLKASTRPDVREPRARILNEIEDRLRREDEEQQAVKQKAGVQGSGVGVQEESEPPPSTS